jgi:hypothetical protein
MCPTFSKAFEKHQKTNKHKKAVEALKEFMTKENDLMNGEDDEEVKEETPVQEKEGTFDTKICMCRTLI